MKERYNFKLRYEVYAYVKYTFINNEIKNWVPSIEFRRNLIISIYIFSSV